MTIQTTLFDAAEHLDTPEAQADFLADAFEEGDPGYICHALGIVARAKGMTEIAKAAGVTREGLYKSLAQGGDPRLSTLMGVLKSLGLKMSVMKSDSVTECTADQTARPKMEKGRKFRGGLVGTSARKLDGLPAANPRKETFAVIGGKRPAARHSKPIGHSAGPVKERQSAGRAAKGKDPGKRPD